MRCADPVLCYTKSNGKRLFRNFSFVKKNTLYIQAAQQLFDCGKCIFCRKKRAYELACRCVLHASLYQQNCFITLTYDESKDGYHNEFNYPDIQKFKKRLRQECWRRHKKRVEVYNVHEYGKNGKKHWHLILFNHDFDDKTIYTKKNGLPIYTSEKLAELWPYGFNTVADVNEATAMYQSQYMEKDFKNGNVGTNKKCHSKHSGIGKAYFLKYFRQILSLGYIPVNGGKLPLPRYFQRIADRHYSHFYEQSAFFDTINRKAKHRPFNKETPSRAIADLYLRYKNLKEEYMVQLEEEWNEVVSDFLTTRKDPDFISSCNNYLRDLKNKKSLDKF